MPPTFLFDLNSIDLTKVVIDKETIQKSNPQRYEMDQLDGVIWYDKEKFLILGYKDLTENEFWVRGHIPGRPLMPGVIMIEAAAQLSSVFVKEVYKLGGFIGFAGIEEAKFRMPIPPGKRLYLLCNITVFKKRMFTAVVQGVVDGAMAFNTTISGLNV